MSIKTEVAIIGGGLAGLTAAIVIRRMGFSVVLIEKKKYPFHKVCGEYISLEAEDILNWLGLPVKNWNLPIIDNFRITHPQTKDFRSKLPLGGLGISRFKLDDHLKKLAEIEGVMVYENSKVNQVTNGEKSHILDVFSTETFQIESDVVLGAFGRNKPHFATSETEKQTPQKGFIGAKMHIQADLPKNLIELHHFSGGYCGISAIENDLFCICYLIDSQIVKENKGDFQKVETSVLSRNRNLDHYFSDFEKRTERVSTAGVYFSPRPISNNGILFLGDSAGMIPPLAGNGMSMAIHSAVLASEVVKQFLLGKINKQEMVKNYESSWNSAFKNRLKMARTLQNIMQIDFATRLSLDVFNLAPSLFKLAARSTHGIQIPVPKIL